MPAVLQSMGFFDDLRRVTGLNLRLLGTPAAALRELVLQLRSSPETYYDFLGDDVLEAQDQAFANPDKPLWLNLGYWKKARTYPEACADLARKLAAAAHFGANDIVLDAGFGFGEQDMLWVREYGVQKIIGVNVTRRHVEVASKRVEAAGLADRIDFRLGSATELDLPAASVDKVVALESAFHFDTRERFFEQAQRVLKPGGRIALADCVPYLGEKPSGLTTSLALRRWGIPTANMYDRDVYRQKLTQHGFGEVEIESIRNYVFPGMAHYSALRHRGVPMEQAVIELSEDDVASCFGLEGWARSGGLTDYIVASAVRQ